MLIKSDPSVITSYFEDNSNLKGGHASSVVFPADTAQLCAALKDADSKHIPVTVSGGGTGTTGSRIPFGGIVISLEKFKTIVKISAKEKTASVEAGVTVEDLKRACEKEKLFYACHPTEGGAFVGGTVSTNASGARSFKYGPTRGHVMRLEMALACGSVLEVRRREKFLTKNNSAIDIQPARRVDIPLPSYRMPDVKNAAGYFAMDGMDLIDLFIGQEGTLSVITAADILLHDLPSDILSSFVFFKSAAGAFEFAAAARRMSRAPRKNAINALSIEYLDANALELLRLKGARVPAGAKASIFFEQEMPAAGADSITDAWLELMSGYGASADDSWVAMTPSEAEELNKLRHSVPESVNEIVRRNGYNKLSTDIAVPEKNFKEMFDLYESALGQAKIAHVIFGHIGECHLHVNLLPKNEEELKKAEEICCGFYKRGVALGGTISAEHGVGKVRRKYMELMYGAEGLAQMARVKKALDPNCILGRGNIFPHEYLKEA
jgi:D-lactate dehydrogenase (cytochrome)